jgi:hypothetical protein
MVKFARRLVTLIVLGWAVYVAAGASWTYYAPQDAIDAVLREAAARYRTSLRAGTVADTLLAEIRESVARNAGRGTFRRDARVVAVSATAAGISATVQYAVPVIKDILVVPLSVNRSLREGLQS